MPRYRKISSNTAYQGVPFRKLNEMDVLILFSADCGALPNPSNGKVILTGSLLGSSANYSCDPGYGIVGEAKVVCQSDGTWSGSPLCQGTNYKFQGQF